MSELQPNKGKQLTREIGGVSYARYPIRTHVVTKDDTIQNLVEKYAVPHLQPGDILCMSERVVAITQGRAYPIAEIVPSRLATLLSKFVHKSKYGIGLGSPWTMELALKEVGTPRILLAAVVAAVTKPFGLRGMFYHVAGRGAAAIDGPCDYTLPPYNKYATLGPKNPNVVAKELEKRFGCPISIIDANDLGVDVLGRSNKSISASFIAEVFRDNPLGQSDEQTPLCIVRKSPVS